MRELTMAEASMLSGGGGTERFNRCMATNWAKDTTTGAVAGGIAGAFLGPGAFLGAVVGAMGASTATSIYCAGEAFFGK